MTTLRQIESNRRNSKLSSGPRTELGKQVSRANSVTHGLSGAGVVLPAEEEEAVRRRTEEWAESFKTETAYGRWLAGQIALEAVRIDLCQHHDLALRIHMVERAENRWEDDRRHVAERLGASLAKRPAQVVSGLKQTPQGCDWLLERWSGLSAALDHQGQWTDIQRELALDLLGTPAELRDVPGRLDTREAQAEAARGAIERLTRSKTEVLAVLDAIEQEAAAQGTPILEDRDLARLRRYESACRRQMQRALGQLSAEKGDTAEAPASPPFGRSPSLSHPRSESKCIDSRSLDADRERQLDLLCAELDAAAEKHKITHLMAEEFQRLHAAESGSIAIAEAPSAPAITLSQASPIPAPAKADGCSRTNSGTPSPISGNASHLDCCMVPPPGPGDASRCMDSRVDETKPVVF